MSDYAPDDFVDFGPPPSRTCQHCGATGLYWGDVGTGRKTVWVLFEGGEPHRCRFRERLKDTPLGPLAV